MPGSVIEAMALETPVVASDLPQVREIVSDECAMLVRPGDIDGFTKAILECAEKRHATERRVERAFNTFGEHFTITEHRSTHARFLRAVPDAIVSPIMVWPKSQRLHRSSPT